MGESCSPCNGKKYCTDPTFERIKSAYPTTFEGMFVSLQEGFHWKFPYPYYPCMVRYICLHLVDFYGFHVGKYTSPMDAISIHVLHQPGAGDVSPSTLFVELLIFCCPFFFVPVPTRWAPTNGVIAPINGLRHG